MNFIYSMDEGLTDEVDSIDAAEGAHLQGKEVECLVKPNSCNMLQSQEMVIPGEVNALESSFHDLGDMLEGKNVLEYGCTSPSIIDNANEMVEELTVRNCNGSNLPMVGTSNNRERMQMRQNHWQQFYHLVSGSGSGGYCGYRNTSQAMPSNSQDVGYASFSEILGHEPLNDEQNEAAEQLMSADNNEVLGSQPSHGGIKTKILSKSGFSEFFVKTTLKGKGIICRGPSDDASTVEPRHQNNTKFTGGTMVALNPPVKTARIPLVASNTSLILANRTGMTTSKGFIGPRTGEWDNDGMNLREYFLASFSLFCFRFNVLIFDSPKMGFQHRKLLDDSIYKTLPDSCNGCYSSCGPSCFKSCPQLCHDADDHDSPVSEYSSPAKKPLIITFTVLAAAFLVLCCYVYYVRRFRRRSNVRTTRSQPETTETHDEFLDEDHGPIVDHHIWYINTVGLQPSIVNSIAVFKYKKGEGLVEGTECAVCLNEFEEDETLRLLPKCSHAFHIPCIDTWLRSHTNCPMCRAPIVSNTADKGPSSSSEVNTEGTQRVIVEDDGESERETEGGTSEIRIRPDEEDELAVEIETERNRGESSGPMRRSVSLDSMAASQISQDLANGVPEGSNGNLNNGLVKGKEPSARIVSSRAAGNQSLLGLMCHSSIGRSLQIRPNFMKRSFSCNGKFTLPTHNKSRNSNPPVRSF